MGLPEAPKTHDDTEKRAQEGGDDSAASDAMRKKTGKFVEDLTNPDSKYNRIFQSFSFNEAELEREEFDDNPQLFIDYLFGKNQDLQEYINSFPEADRADIKEKIIERIKKETYPKWKEGHKMYCPDTAKLLIDNGKEIVDEMKFVEEELEREELDEDNEKLMEFLLKKSPELAEFRKQLGGKALKKFDEDVMGKAKEKWKKGHKMYCPDTAKLLIDNGKEIVEGMNFVEAELDREELDDDPKKLEEFLLGKDPELAELRSALAGKALKKFDEEVMGPARAKWKEGHKVYCPETAKLTIKEGADIAKEMKFSEQELSKDELHDNPDELKKFLLQKDALGELRDGLKGKALKKFDEEVTEPLMKRWGEEHEAFEFADHKEKIMEGAEKGEIPPHLKDQKLTEGEFTSRWFDYLADQEDELRQPKHADIRKKLSEDQKITDTIKKRYPEVKQAANLEEVKGKIDEAIKNIRFTPEEISEDKYHDNPDAFVEAFKGRIGDELLEKMEAMSGANKEAGKAYLLQQLKAVKYPEWKEQHEARELQEKEGVMLEKLQGKIPPEIAAENLKGADFFKKLFDHYASEDEELNDPKHADLRKKLSERSAIKTAIQEKQQEYQEAAAARLTDSLKSSLEALTFSEAEYKEEKYHTDLKAFGEYVVNGKLDPQLLKQLDFLDADKKKAVMENLSTHAQEQLHPDWKKNHEALEEKDITAKLVSNIKQGKISADMKANPLSAGEFGQRYLESILESSEIAFDEPHHQAMRERILKSSEIRSALTERHQAYREELKAGTRAEIDRELQNMQFSEQERDNDDFHDNPKAFALAMQGKLGEKLKARIQVLDGDSSELANYVLEQLEKHTYKNWLSQHESAEEKKFIDELTEKIGSEPITAEFAQEHYEEDEFRQAWYERIADKLSPDLREEHQEAIQGLLQKSRVQEAFQKKFQEYEPMHEKILEEQFTGELSELMRSLNIPEEMLQQDLSQTEFTAKYFALLLSHASPKMREELEEHPQLLQALLSKQDIQTGIKERSEQFQKLREKKQLEEVTKESLTLLQQHPIPATILAKGVDSPEFQEHLFELLQSRLSPELRKVLGENKAFRELLLKQQELQQALKQKHQENRDRASKANKVKDTETIQARAKDNSAEGRTLESEKEADEMNTTKKDAEGISDQEIEALTASPLGQQRLDGLRQSFGLRTLLRRREQFFTIFLQKWLSTISDYEFRNFSRLVRKKGTTPQQIIAAMTTNSHRKVRLQKLKFLNQSDWRRFTQGLQYIKVKPEDLVAGRLSVETVQDQKEPVEKTPASATENMRSRVDELFEQQQTSEDGLSVDQSEFEEPEADALEHKEAPMEMADEIQVEPIVPLDELLQVIEKPLIQADENISEPKEPEMMELNEEEIIPKTASIEEPHQQPEEEPGREVTPEKVVLQEHVAEVLGEPPTASEDTDAPIEVSVDQQPVQTEVAMDKPQEEVEEIRQPNLQAESVSQEPMGELLPEQPFEEEMLVQGQEQEILEPERIDDMAAPESAADEPEDLEEQMQRVVMGIDQEQRSLRRLTRQLEEAIRVLRTIDGDTSAQKTETITWVAERLRHRILLELMQQISSKQASQEQLDELLYRYQLLMLKLANEEKKGSLEDDQGGELRQRIMLGTLLNRFLFAIRLQNMSHFETSISIDSACLGASVTNADDVYAELWQQYADILKQKAKIAHVGISHGKELTDGEVKTITLTVQYLSKSQHLIDQKSIQCLLEEDLIPSKKKLREIPQAA